jgi:ribose-phosphate pyrophosphokinase
MKTMKILDLVDQEKEEKELKYKISKFPDGQQSINLNFTYLNDEVTIKSRLNDFKDLEVILCATSALKNIGVKKIHLYVPYFLGARSDRKFVDGSINYLKDVICPIINSQGYETVTIVDAHSDVLEACIQNYKKIDNINLVKFALTDIDNTKSAREKLILVSPDAGALKKMYHVSEHFDINQMVIANKHRDIKTGKITHTEVPGLTQEPGSKNFVIIDDICDGGRTFLEIAKTIRKEREDSVFNDKIYLVATHGIFSGGFNELKNWIDGIYCTNSVKDVDNELVKQLNIF